MLENLFTASSTTTTFSGVLINILISIILGVIVSFTYMQTNKRSGYTQSFVLTMVFLPAIVSMIIFLIDSNIARAFSLAGAFSIIRFRSAPGEPKDIAFVLFTMASGLACGVGSIGYAILFTLILCLLMIILDLIKFGENKLKNQLLKITIPEDLNYEEAFNEIFSSFNVVYQLQKVKTTELGSLYQLVYEVSINSNTKQKEFLDAIRVKNGNLDISLLMMPTKMTYLN